MTELAPATATLEILTGCSRGKIQLLGEMTLIGRQDRCDFTVADATISRQHARIERRADGYYLEDLHSRNGTTVNGAPVTGEVQLNDGDIVHLHTTALVFRTHAGDAAQPGRTGPPISEEFEPLASQQVVDAAPARLDADDALQPADIRALDTMLRCLGVSLDIEQVLLRVLDGLFEVFPQAERGIVLLAEPSGELLMRAVKVRPAESSGLTFGPLARRAAAQAMASRLILLYADPGGSTSEQDSVIDMPTRSTMCAPLLGPTQTPPGAVHLDTADTGQPFTKDHLRTLRVAAAVACQSIEYALAFHSIGGRPK